MISRAGLVYFFNTLTKVPESLAPADPVTDQEVGHTSQYNSV